MTLIRDLVNEGGGMLADTGDQDKSDLDWRVWGTFFLSSSPSLPSSFPLVLLYLLPLSSF